MRPRVLLLVVGVVLIGVVVWLAWRQSRQVPLTAGPAPTGVVAASSATPFSLSSTVPAAARGTAGSSAATPAPVIATAPSLAVPVAPGASPAESATGPSTPPPPRSPTTDLDKVRHMITDYHTLMGENPVGTNAEIMRALAGKNPHQAMLGPPDGQSLNDKGELVDQWGTPYFFHQLSKDRMEIRSAGADKIMYTPDDIIVR